MNLFWVVWDQLRQHLVTLSACFGPVLELFKSVLGLFWVYLGLMLSRAGLRPVLSCLGLS